MIVEPAKYKRISGWSYDLVYGGTLRKGAAFSDQSDRARPQSATSIRIINRA